MRSNSSPTAAGLIYVMLAASVVFLSPCSAPVAHDGLIPDSNLEQAIRETIQKPEGNITESDLQGLTRLDAAGHDITSIEGLQSCVNLTDLSLTRNEIRDISPLTGLTNLTHLTLMDNKISDIGPLAGLTNLTELGLQANEIRDITALAGLTNLSTLTLPMNPVRDIDSLEGLTNLSYLSLWDTRVTDIRALVNNPGLGEGDEVWLSRDQLSTIALNSQIPALQSRGVLINLGAS